MRRELDAREYKLLLDPVRFSGEASQAVDILWNDHMKPLIDSALGRRNGDEARYAGRFELTEQRTVRFLDADNCCLTRADLALRERRRITDTEETSALAEIALKLRMPDLFIVASADLAGADDNAETKFEEDIAPLEVDKPDGQDSGVVVSPTPSFRSRFSLSTKQKAKWPSEHATLGDVEALIPSLREVFKSAGVAFDPHATLSKGPEIHEKVFKGASVTFGGGSVGKFSLTFWYFLPERSVPMVAEISFKCATEQGQISANAARRAFILFIGMQSDLGDWLNMEHSSKTALALPAACRKSGTRRSPSDRSSAVTRRSHTHQ